MKLKEFPKKAKHPARPRYSLRKDLGFWTVTMEGRKAIFKDEQGAYYVAYLLLHQPPEPIHGMALALKSNALYGMSRKGAVTTEVVDPATGKVLPVASDAIFQQRSLGLEEAEAAWALRRKEQELEAVLDDEDQIEPVKAEVTRELLEIYDFQKKNPTLTRDAAQRAVRAVRTAIGRFHRNLALAVDAKGQPHAILGAFASHLEKYLIIPSARYSKTKDPLARAGLAGCFVYERPARVAWEM